MEKRRRGGRKNKRRQRGGGGDERRIRGSRQSEDLTIEIKCSWQVNKMITAVIITNTAISKSFIQYLSNIPGKHKTKEVQKTATLGTANLLWKEIL
jgi:hypothetical protein